MAGTTGTAREEAERLVATLLAMAATSGLGAAARGGDPKKDKSSGTPESAAETPESSTGASGLGNLLSGLVDQFLGTTGQQSGSGRQSGSDHPQRKPDPQPGSGQQGWFGQQRGAGQHGGGWATGSAECCVCPVCRAITSLRDPTPEAAERLATGAGDFASGVASLLRAFSVVTGTSGTSARRRQPPRPAPTPDQAWSAATRDRTAKPAERVPTEQDVRAGADPWTAATRTPRPEPEPTTAEPVETEFEAVADEEIAGPDTDESIPAARAGGDPWAAATRAPKRPTRSAGAAPSVSAAPGVPTTGAAAAAAAATPAGDGGDTRVAGGGSVDHDVPGPAAAGGISPAARAAEDRDGGAGDEARPGDAV